VRGRHAALPLMYRLQAILQAASRIAGICVEVVLLDTFAVRVRALFPVAAAAVWLLAPSAAWADVPHTVAHGESLWSVAQTDGLSVAQLAAANGLSSTSHLVAGTTLMIPPQSHAGGNRRPRAAVTGGNAGKRAAVSGGTGDTNVIALVQTNIGSIQANIGSSSQYNTADGSAVQATGASAGNARAGNAGNRGPGGSGRGRTAGTAGALIRANVGSSDSSNTTGGPRAQANGDNAGAAIRATGGVGPRTRAAPSLWNRPGELATPVTLARTWLALLLQLAEGATD
jgi:LysM repeat protein